MRLIEYKTERRSFTKPLSDILCSIDFIFALFVLILNDHFLKVYYPNLITGKISDFAGLYVLSLFISQFSQRRFFPFIMTGMLFMLWKLPLADRFIHFWNDFAPYSISRVVDYTDLWALAVLPLAYKRLHTKRGIPSFSPKKGLAYGTGILTCVAVLATAGTTGMMKRYHFKNSKREVYLAIQKLLSENPSYKVPDSLKSLVSGSPPLRPKKSIDSLDFYFYIPSQEPDYNIYYCDFLGQRKDWYNKKESDLALVAVVTPEGRRIIRKDIGSKELGKIQKTFESHIMDKLKIPLTLTID